MKTYFRTNDPSENDAIKRLLNNEEVDWSGDSKYSIGDYILVYITIRYMGVKLLVQWISSMLCQYISILECFYLLVYNSFLFK